MSVSAPTSAREMVDESAMSHPTVMSLVEAERTLHPLKDHFNKLAQSVLHTAPQEMELIFPEPNDGPMPVSDLLFYMRFLVIAGHEYFDTYISKFRECRGEQDADPTQDAVCQAALVATSYLQFLKDDCEMRTLYKAEIMERRELYERTVVIAAYAQHSVSIWHVYNNAKKDGKSMTDATLKKEIRNLKRERRPFEDALASFLDEVTDNNLMNSSIRNALLEPELGSCSSLKDVADKFKRAKKAFKKVKLLETEWERLLAAGSAPCMKPEEVSNPNPSIP